MAGAGTPLDVTRLRASLGRTPAAVRALVAGLDDDDARWRPASGTWSIVEIVNHLADEDADDFAARLERTLRDPTLAWDPIDPERAAADRRYNERELAASVDRFEAVRRSSLNWLDGALGEGGDGAGIDWSMAHAHPKFGPMPAGMLLVSWAAHDHLHVRQIAKRLFELTARDSGGFDTRYAGEW